MHKFTLLFFGFSIFAINVYGHLGYEIAPKWFRNSIFFEFINSSVYHNLHHSKFKGNYGLYFRFWDKIMGTEHEDYVKMYDEIQSRRFLNPDKN
jgi:sterol desaturase/sphingolipid hydroxylase (fatty acid hydroxylase superfamily)